MGLFMYLDQRRASAVISAVWLFGFAALLYTGYWWPGLLFVLGVSSIVEGFVQGRGWYACQGGLWLIGFGFLFMAGFHREPVCLPGRESVSLLAAFVRASRSEAEILRRRSFLGLDSVFDRAQE